MNEQHTEKPAELHGWIPILVRAADYRQVADLVAARELERLAADSSASAPVEGDSVDPRLLSWPAWSVEALRQLSESKATTAQRWARAMDVIAIGDENWYPTSAVAAMSGMTISEWRDAPRKITRHLKAQYEGLPTDGNGNYVWPLRAFAPKGSTEVSWGMPPENKRLWREIRGL